MDPKPFHQPSCLPTTSFKMPLHNFLFNYVVTFSWFLLQICLISSSLLIIGFMRISLNNYYNYCFIYYLGSAWVPLMIFNLPIMLIVKKWKMNRVKEEKGFLHREVMQVTLSGYWLDSLVTKLCLCSYVTPSGYCPGLLAAEKHQRWN